MTETDYVTIAILAKEKAHVLPLYLQQIEKQTYPASKIKLYIRTNNNRDQTAEILAAWVDKVKGKYSEIHFDASDVEEKVENYEPHEWNSVRLSVIRRIREESLIWARERGTHYFSVDCDNFITADTLETLLKTNLSVIGPMLRNTDSPTSLYANYHFVVDGNGYYKNHPLYFDILYKNIKGIIEVEVIHTTYLVRNEVLDKVTYEDQSGRFDYVIFSDSLRKAGIPQYLDNRKYYGFLTFCDTVEDFVEKNKDISL